MSEHAIGRRRRSGGAHRRRGSGSGRLALVGAGLVAALIASVASSPVSPSGAFLTSAAQAPATSVTTATVPPVGQVSGGWASDGSALTVTWGGASSGTGYTVWRSSDAGATWSSLGSVTGRLTTSWSDPGAAAGTRYFVQTLNQGWTSPRPTNGAADGGGVVFVAPPPPVTYIEDTFGGTGPLGTTEVGGVPWQFLNGGGWERRNYNGFTTANNTATTGIAYVDFGRADAYALLNRRPMSGAVNTMLYFRIVDANNWVRLRGDIAYVGGCPSTEHILKLEVSTAGSITTPWARDIGCSSNTSVDSLGVRAEGDKISVFWNGLSETVTVAAHKNATKWGFGTAVSNLFDVDAFAVEPLVPSLVSSATASWFYDTINVRWKPLITASAYKVWKSYDEGATWAVLAAGTQDEYAKWAPPTAQPRYFIQTIRINGETSPPPQSGVTQGPNIANAGLRPPS